MHSGCLVYVYISLAPLESQLVHNVVQLVSAVAI